MSRRLIALYAVLAVLAALALAAAWVLTTPAGLQWAYAALRPHAPGTLAIDALEGRLIGPLEVRGLRYRADGTDARLAYARLEWSPLALLGGTLEIDRLNVRGLDVRLPPESEPPTGERPALRPPLEVRAGNVRLEDIRITRAGQAPYAIDALALDAEVSDERVRIAQLRVSGPNFDLQAQGALGLAPGTEGTLTMRWRIAPSAQPAFEGAGEIRGRLARLQIDQRITAPLAADLSLQITDVLGDLGWEGRLEIPALDPRRFGLDLPPAEARLSLQARGGREQFRASGYVRAKLPELPPLTGRFRVSGGRDGPIVLEELVLQPLDGPARVTVQGQWRPDDARWQAHAAWQALQWPLAGAPRVRSPGGTLDASGTAAQYRLALQAQAVAENLPPLQVRAEGQGDRGGLVLDTLHAQTGDAQVNGSLRLAWAPEIQWQTRLAWQDLRWPFDADPRVHSPSGTLAASGSLERYRFDLDAATLAADLPDARWHARGTGDRAHVMLEDLRLETLGTTLHGRARAAWSPALAWEVELQGDGIDPARAWPQWPGRLALEARASGDAHEQRLRIDNLQGRLREQAFHASARALRRGDDYPALALELRSGGATARVSGALTDAWQLDWRVEAGALGSLLPGAGGRLAGTGRITGPRASPQVTAEISGTNLRYDTTRLQSLELAASIDLSDRTRSRIRMQAADGALLGRPFQRLALDARGLLADHSATLALELPDVGLHAELAGGYAEDAWSGRIESSRLRIARRTWTLAGTPALRVSRDRVALEQSCWGARQARVCIALDHAPDTTTFEAAANRLPLALFEPLLPIALDLAGTISGAGSARLEAGRLRTADAHFKLGDGALALPAPADATIDYEGASVDLTVDAEGLRAEAQLTVAGSDGGRAVLALPRFHAADALLHQPIEGHIAFRMSDLAPVAALLPRLEEVKGRLALELTLAGTLADPRLRGRATLAEASAYVPASGIQVHDVRVTARATGGEALEISGEAHAGDGKLALSGRVTFPGAPAWQAELRIAGDEFLAAALGKTRVYVSPDLRAELAPGRVEVAGAVRIPHATFTLARPGGPDVVRPSPDVVIVNAPEKAPAPPELWQVSAKIRLILGEQVTFTGFGLNAGITGEVLLIDVPGQATTARGELRVAQGQYEAYGQRLEIERGRLLFVGGPVTNPGIDARAVRVVDNVATGKVTAGVEVSGTLQDPQLTLFSDPAMGQADALSYLLFGRPMSGASSAEGRSLAAAARALQLAGGERLAQRIGAQFGFEEVEIETGTTQESAALVLGRRLSPRLYVNYSIGLFEPSNVLRLRYQLTPNWSLEAQSGTSSGGDLLYTLER